MPLRPALLLPAAAIPLVLGSCGLLRLPVRAVGAVVEGTAEAGKTIGKSATRPFAKTPQEKAQAAKEKAGKDERKLKEKQAKVKGETDPKSGETLKENAEGSPGIPAAPVNEPLPDDSLPLPYEDPNALPPPPPEGY